MDEVRDLAVTPEEAPRWASFTQDDYRHSDAPLDLLDAEPDPTRRMRLLEDMARDAKSKGYGNFRSLYNLHAKERRKTPSAKPAERRFVEGGNIVEGIDLEREIGCEMKDVLLYCGEWESDTEGVRKLTPRGKIMVCPHPIFPIQRSVDLSDGGCEAMKVAFFNHGKWTIVSAPRSTFAVRDSLVRFLSENGAAVTSETGG